MRLSGVIRVGNVRLDVSEYAKLVGREKVLEYLKEFLVKVRDDVESSAQQMSETDLEIIRKWIDYKKAELEYDIEALRLYIASLEDKKG